MTDPAGLVVNGALIVGTLASMWRLTSKIADGPVQNITKALEKLIESMESHDRRSQERHAKMLELLITKK